MHPLFKHIHNSSLTLIAQHFSNLGIAIALGQPERYSLLSTPLFSTRTQLFLHLCKYRQEPAEETKKGESNTVKLSTTQGYYAPLFAICDFVNRLRYRQKSLT